MGTLAGIGPPLHVEDLKTCPDEPGSHAVGGPDVGGGHRMGKGFTVSPLKEPDEESSAGSKAASQLPQRSLKILHERGHEVDALNIGAQPRQKIGPMPGPGREPLTVFSVRTYC